MISHILIYEKLLFTAIYSFIFFSEGYLNTKMIDLEITNIIWFQKISNKRNYFLYKFSFNNLVVFYEIHLLAYKLKSLETINYQFQWGAFYPFIAEFLVHKI